MVRDHQERRWNFCNRPGEKDKSECITANIHKGVPYNVVAEPISYCTDKNIEHLMRNFGSKGKIVDEESKTPTLMAAAGMGGGNHIYYADSIAEPLQYAELSEEYYKGCADGNLVGMIENEGKYKNGKQPSQQYRAYSCEGKSVCVDADSRKYYMMPYEIKFDDDGKPIKAVNADGKEITIYEVRDGKITIKGKQYPIKLRDGYYIIRKLTVSECKRLQTVPEWYDFSVISNSQAYKCLGNGWTCDIISILMNACLASNDTDVLPGQIGLWG